MAGADGQLVLIDGYLRVEAVRRCGKDTVLADIWPCKEDEAIVRVLSRSQERPWEAVEQGALIAELRGRSGWSLGGVFQEARPGPQLGEPEAFAHGGAPGGDPRWIV